MATSSPAPVAPRPKLLLLIACGLAGIAANGLLAFANKSSWDVDFNQYYAAGKLVGSGRLYDWNAIRPLELERNAKAVPFGRFPVFALVFKPLSALPYPVARAVWFGAGLAALAGFVYLWPFSSRMSAGAAVCWSAPATMCLAIGQDSILFLFFAAAGLRLLVGGRDFLAGLVFSACAAKPHLALLVPVLLVARCRWKALLGGAAGGAACMLLSFAAEGRDWPQRLLTLAGKPEFDPAAARMPNLRGLLSILNVGITVEIAVGLVIVAALWRISRREPLPAAGALVLAAGLLLSHHAYFYDAVLLMPALLLPYQTPHPAWLRTWALVLLTPFPYLFLLTSLGLPGHLAITGYTLALIVTYSITSSSSFASTVCPTAASMRATLPSTGE